MFGSVTASDPSFGVLAARTIGYVWPPSFDRLIFTFAVEIGAASVPATFQVTVWVDAPLSVAAVFGAVTRNGPVPVASSTAVSALDVPPFRSRAVSRKCRDAGLAFVPAKPT